MYSYYVRRRNVTVRQKVFRALLCEPQNSELRPVVLSNSYLEHLRGKRDHKILLDGQKRILVEFGRSRPCAALNELASSLCNSNGEHASTSRFIRGSAWIILAEEKWFCLWQPIASEYGSRSLISAELVGEHLVETVRQIEKGEVVVWQRWLFREERDYKVAREITGTRSASAGFPTADEIHRPHQR